MENDLRRWMRLVEGEQTPAKTVIDAITQYGNDTGLVSSIDMDLDWDGNDTVRIDMIETRFGVTPVPGAGAKMLRQLCKFADHYGVILTAHVINARLVLMHKRLGFVIHGEPEDIGDGDMSYLCRREPHTSNIIPAGLR